MESESRPSETEPSRVADSSLSDLSDSDSDDAQANARQVEWLATTREKRSTAGNRMKSMLANEEPDSDLELLFAEDEDDAGFTDVGDDGSDVHMDSSSDDEDEKKAGEDDDLEGEKELERQAKERRAAQRKRRAQEAIPAKFRKKVRIDPTTPTSTTATPAPRPKKKSERASWLPSPADLPTRASSRQTTRLSKEQLHQQMVEREAKRLKQLAQMQKKAARLEAMKKPPMTQEERLREAAIVEKRNSKSLNRWEEAEKQREEERRARLAALNERTLKGPVITFWSGLGEWVDGRLKHIGRHVVIEDKPPPKKQKKEKEKEKDDKTKDKVGEIVKGEDGKETSNGNDAPTTKAQDEVQEEQPSSNSGTGAPPKAEGGELASASEKMPTESTLATNDTAATTSTSTAVTTTATATATTSSPTTASATPNTTSTPTAPTVAPVPLKVEESPRPIMAVPASGLAAPAPAPAPTPVSSSSSIQPPDRPASVMTPPPGLSRPPPESKPSGVLAPPSLAPPPSLNVNGGVPRMSNVLAPPDTSQGSVPPPAMGSVRSQVSSSSPPSSSLQPPSSTPLPDKSLASQQGTTSPQPVQTNNKPAAPKVATTIAPPFSELPVDDGHPPNATATRNAIVFQNFDENALRDKGVQTQILFGRKMNKLPSMF